MGSAYTVGKYLTPADGVPALPGVRELRREARREMSERVRLFGADGVRKGWTLDVSRTGVRVILDSSVTLGESVEVTIGRRRYSRVVKQGLVVWFEEDRECVVAGIAFIHDRTVVVGRPCPE